MNGQSRAAKENKKKIKENQENRVKNEKTPLRLSPMSSAAEQLPIPGAWQERGLHVGTVPSDPKYNGMQNPVLSIFYMPSIAMSAFEPNNDAVLINSPIHPVLHPLQSILCKQFVLI